MSKNFSDGLRADNGKAEAARETVESLIAYCRENDRVCPQPVAWDRLWKTLPDRKQLGTGWQPALPLILAAWHDTPAMLKMLRLAEHIQWAETHAALAPVSKFLRELSEAEWFHIGD